MIRLSPPMSRFAALALLALAVALVYALLVRPLADAYVGQRDAIAEQQDLLDRYRRFAAARADLAEALEALRNDRSAQEGYLQGENETLVAAQLQNRIRSVVQATGAKLSSTQVLQGADEQGFRRISVRVSMACSIADLQKIFHQLEGGRPYLFLDNIDISGEQARRRPGDPAAREDLNVSFDVFGFIRVS
jgi:general secretion pathway protein M